MTRRAATTPKLSALARGSRGTPVTKVTDRYLEERRQEILEAARRVFVEKGYSAATMNDIASEAEVAAGSIYRYFEGKTDLIAAVARGCVEEDLETWKTTPQRSPSPGAAFLAVGEGVRTREADSDYREMCILRLESYLAASRDPELQVRITDTLQESVDGLAEIVRAAQQSGEFDDRLDPISVSKFLHAFGAGVGAMSTVCGDRFSARDAWGLLISFVGSAFSQELLAQIGGSAAKTDEINDLKKDQNNV
jgi:TetR/AcrR family transcriptional regulator, transcriptional repressor of aconitase